jgi:EmrB/QacA subfamily drug resistance transporter
VRAIDFDWRNDIMTTAAEGEARRWLILGLVLIAQFMGVLDATIVTVALPSIQHGLHFGSQLDLQWVINAYALFFGGFLLLGGRAGDLLGHKRLFVTGLVVFTAASLFNGLAQSTGMLVTGRAVQGLGAALVSPAVLAIILGTFREVAERTKALGCFTAVTASGSAVGILAGGVLTDVATWRWIFLVNVPIGLIALLGGARFIPNAKLATGAVRRMDLPGAVTITGALTLLVFTIVNAGQWGWSSVRIIVLLVAAALLLAAFLVIELATRHPLVRLGIFRIRTVTVANLTMFFMVAGLYAMMFFPALFLGQVKGYSPIGVGLAYLPWPASMAVAAGVTQKLAKAVGVRIPLAAGLVILAAGLFTFWHLSAGGSYVADVLPGMIVTAVGAGMAWAIIFLVATAGVSHEESGLASGIVNSAQQVGAALGLSVLSTIAATRTRGILAHGTPPAQALTLGFQRGFIVGGVIVIVGAVIAAFVVRGSDGQQTAAPDTPALTLDELVDDAAAEPGRPATAVEP